MSGETHKWLREPLLHFIVAGALLFALYGVVSDSEPERDDRIVVTTGQVEHMTSLFLKTWNRLPTERELTGLIDAYITEEILYREAMRIGIDKDDTIIRRRLRQKMEFLFDDYTAIEPTEDELQVLLSSDPERYRTEPRISFEHIYLKDGSMGQAESLLADLRANRPVDANVVELGGLVPPTFDDARHSEVANRFGPAFADQLFLQSPGRWSGPIESPFGVHLVLVDSIVPGRLPSLAEISADVERDWRSARRAEAEQVIVDGLREQYVITIEAYDESAP